MSAPLSLTLIFESNWLYLPILRKIVKEIGKEKFTSEETIEEVAFSLHEAVGNIIHHAYQNEPHHLINLKMSWDEKEFSLELLDRGLAHDPQKNEALAHPPVHSTIDLLREDGRGVFLIHHFMDEVKYRHENGINILLLKKWIC